MAEKMKVTESFLDDMRLAYLHKWTVALDSIVERGGGAHYARASASLKEKINEICRRDSKATRSKRSRSR